MRISRKTGAVLCLLNSLLLAGCNATSPDVSIVQSNANATIGYLGGLVTPMQATLTALGTMATQLAQAQDAKNTLQAEYAQAVSQLNGSSGVSAPTLAPLAQNNATPAPVVTPNTAGSNPTPPANQTPNGFTMDTPVTAKNIDGSGCPVGATTTFSTTDAKIWIIAKVHSLKKGMVFTAAWTGTPQHQDTWTSTYSAVVTCIHFYVVPKTLGMIAGNWQVSLNLADNAPQTVNFTLTDAGTTPLATAAAN